MADNPFRSAESDLDDPANDAFALTKSDSTVVYARALYIGGTGDVVVTTRGGSVVTFKAVPAGTILPVRISKLMAATTATDVVGLN